MTLHRHIAAANDLASRAFIGMTQWAVRRGLVRRPSLDTEEVGEGAFRYRVQRDLCRTTLERHPIENAHEMAFDAAGRLYLLTDHPRNNVLVFDPDGEVVDAWTLGMRGAHGLTLATEEGREVLYICDAYGPRVVKCTLSGEVLMTLPSPHHLGVYRAHEPYLPTQSAVAPNGDI